MERIKPIDLERAPILRAFRGYHRNTVDLLLGRASKTIEELLSEEQRLKAENERLKAELEQYRALEATMKDGYRARIRNHGHSCFLCEIVIRSQFHTHTSRKHKV
jgi:hypothetical protein